MLAPLPKPIRHIAFIMDGNGRWAKKRLLPRSAGHKKGVEIIQSIVDSCFDDYGIYAVTLFTFSTENWNRPPKEISILFSLLKEFFEKKLDYFKGRGTQIRVLGEIDDPRIPQDVRDTIHKTVEETKGGTKNVFNVLFNYGGRDDILRACQKLSQEVKEGRFRPEEITPKLFSSYLYTGELSDVDLLIRTSGEERVSNCLLWQIAYAEMVFEPTLWPDYTPAVLKKDITIFESRDRRFGAIRE